MLSRSRHPAEMVEIDGIFAIFLPALANLPATKRALDERKPSRPASCSQRRFDSPPRSVATPKPVDDDRLRPQPRSAVWPCIDGRRWRTDPAQKRLPRCEKNFELFLPQFEIWAPPGMFNRRWDGKTDDRNQEPELQRSIRTDSIGRKSLTNDPIRVAASESFES